MWHHARIKVDLKSAPPEIWERVVVGGGVGRPTQQDGGRAGDLPFPRMGSRASVQPREKDCGFGAEMEWTVEDFEQKQS